MYQSIPAVKNPPRGFAHLYWPTPGFFPKKFFPGAGVLDQVNLFQKLMKIAMYISILVVFKRLLRMAEKNACFPLQNWISLLKHLYWYIVKHNRVLSWL